MHFVVKIPRPHATAQREPAASAATAVAREIVDVEVQTLRAPVRDGTAMSFAPLHRRASVLVTVITADGLVGRGESWVNFPSWAEQERRATLREGVLPHLIGRDSSCGPALAQDLLTLLEPLGRQWGAPGPIHQAISAVDIALWDLLARRAGTSIGALLGGDRTHVAAYASSVGPHDVAEAAARCAERGLPAVKVKVGFGAEVDDSNLRAARAAIGDDGTLYADANQAWSLPEAVAAVPMLAEHQVAWIEEPVRGNRLADLEELHDRTGVRIATGENDYGLDTFAELVASPAVAVIQPDVTKVGGLSMAMAVCEEAGRHDTAVIPHFYGGAVGYLATLQLAALAPVVQAVEYDVRANPLRDPLIAGAPAPRDGVITIPKGPGLGRELRPSDEFPAEVEVTR